MVFPTMRAGIVGRSGGSRESFSSPLARLAVQPHPPPPVNPAAAAHPKNPLSSAGWPNCGGFSTTFPDFPSKTPRIAYFLLKAINPINGRCSTWCPEWVVLGRFSRGLRACNPPEYHPNVMFPVGETPQPQHPCGQCPFKTSLPEFCIFCPDKHGKTRRWSLERGGAALVPPFTTYPLLSVDRFFL